MKLAPLYFFIALFTLGFSNEVEAAETLPSIVFDAESAPSTSQKSAISMELLGRAGFYSFNYDYLIQSDLAIGAGFSAFSIISGESNVSTRILPIYANYYFNEGKSRFFSTAGADLILVSGQAPEGNQIRGSGLAGTAGLGYEYKSAEGFLFRAAPYLMLGQMRGAWLGITLGYSI